MAKQQKEQKERIKSQAPSTFEGDVVKIADIVGDEIVVLDYDIFASRYPKTRADGSTDAEAIHVQIEHDGEKKHFYSAADSIKNTLKSIPKDKLPLPTMIEKGKSANNRTIYIFS